MNQQFKKINSKINPKMLFILVSMFILLNQFISHKIRNKSGFYLCNEGISFNLILSNRLWVIWFFFLIFFLVFLIYSYYLKKTSFFSFISVSLASAGIISNMLDRIFYGCVFDYFSLKTFPFIVFNTADIEIFLGLIIFLWFNIKNPPPPCG